MQTIEITRGKDTGFHRVYEQAEADREGLVYLDNWRNGQPGDYVLTDDGFVLEVLHNLPFGPLRLIRTVHGTFRNRPQDSLTTEERESRFKFNGRKDVRGADTRVQLSRYEKLFVELWFSMDDPHLAYRAAFHAEKSSFRTVDDGIRRLLNRQRVLNYMKTHLGSVLDKEGINPSFVVKNIKAIATQKYDPENGHNILPTKLKANAMLGTLVGVFETPRGGRPPAALSSGASVGEIEDAEYESIEADIGDSPQPEAAPEGEMKELPAGDNPVKED